MEVRGLNAALQSPIDAQCNVRSSAMLLLIRQSNPVVYVSHVYTIRALPQGTSITVQYIFVIINGSVIMKREIYNTELTTE